MKPQICTGLILFFLAISVFAKEPRTLTLGEKQTPAVATINQVTWIAGH